MIIKKCFDGDNDEALKMCQHNCYDESLGLWVGMVRQKYQKWIGRSPEWDTLISRWKDTIQKSRTFDHRCIQEAHDLIAAKYRKSIRENRVEDKGIWPDFFNKEAATFLDDEQVLLLFMTSLVFVGSQAGYDAEEDLSKLILNFYAIDKEG